MSSCKYTPFGLCVKTELLKRGETQEWLGKKIKSDYGFFMDSSYMYKILTGQRKAPKVVQAIKEILGLPEHDQGAGKE